MGLSPLAGGRTVETKGMTSSTFDLLTAVWVFFLFLVLTDFFFFDAVGREDFIDFFLTLAGELDLGGVGGSCPPTEEVKRNTAAQRMAQKRMAVRKRIVLTL